MAKRISQPTDKPLDSSADKPAVRQRSKRTPPSESPKPADGPYDKTNISPEEFFAELGKLPRRDISDVVERLIELLDLTDPFAVTELEDSIDDQPHDGELDKCEGDYADDEPSLGSVNTHYNHTRWTEGNRDDREGDPGCDDREGDEEQHGGDEHDGSEPDSEGEPSLGWTIDGFIGGVSDFLDREMDVSCLTQEAIDRYKSCSLYNAPKDGMHVDVDFGIRVGPPRITNLTETQLQVLAPHVDQNKVRL